MATLQDAARQKELETTYGLTPAEAQKALEIAKTEGTGFKDAAAKAKQPVGLKDKVLGAKPTAGVVEPSPIASPVTPAPAPSPGASDKKDTLTILDAVNSKKDKPAEAPKQVAAPSTAEQRMNAKFGVKEAGQQAKASLKSEDADVVGTVDAALTAMDGAVGEEDKSANAAKLKTTAQLIEDKKSEIQSAEDRKAWLGLASQLASALTQYGAARYGMKHGVDMSGLKIEPANLEKSMAYRFKRLDADLAGLEKTKLGEEDAIAKKAQDEISAQKLKDAQLREDALLKGEREFKSTEAQKGRDFTIQENAKRLAASQAKVDAKDSGLKLTPAEKKVDEAYGRIYAERITGGKAADAKKQLKQITDVMTELNSTKDDIFPATGFMGNIPKGLRDVAQSRSSALQERVEDIVQRSSKAILGSAFTAVEASNLIKRAYNPRQSVEENMYRLSALVEQLKEANVANDAAAKHFEDNGTLKGYKGKVYTKADDFDLDPPSSKEEEKDTASKSLTSDEEGRLAELLKLAGE